MSDIFAVMWCIICFSICHTDTVGLNGNWLQITFGYIYGEKHVYLNNVQFIVSGRKLLELLQHCQVPDFINVVVTDIQDTKSFLCKEFRTMMRDELTVTVET